MNPFDANYFVGYVNHVNPQYIKVHFPSSTLLNKNIWAGEEFYGGLVGNFVTIEGENRGFIGKISELDLPEKERLSLSEKAFQSSDFHPTARVDVLLSFDYFNSSKGIRSLNAFPNIGARVYVCAREFIQQYVMQFGKKAKDDLSFEIGKLTSNGRTPVRLSQQALFGRHCAVVGTTGGGKSWTIAKLIEGMIDNHTKAILIDPTGEYKNLSDTPNGISVCFGKNAYYSYKDLTIEDLFFLVRPAPKVQAPKLLEAIRSLKCIEEGIKDEPSFSQKCDSGVLEKTGVKKRDFDAFCYKHKDIIENDSLNFNIENLARQITAECVYDPDYNQPLFFGRRNDNDVATCVSLITRIENVRRTGIYESMFGFGNIPDDLNNLKQIIDDFLSPSQNDRYLLRIGFEEVGFESQAREITANAIAKYLLKKARQYTFKTQPLVLFLDEAHQFLNKCVVDEYFLSASLSAFDQIAKECRKYGLFLCIATQMPKDIPLGTLSQMGTFIIHRLINYYDKEAVKQACSSADADTLSFLPVLGEGEAIISGVDFPMSLSIKVNPPHIEPDSGTPKFIDAKMISSAE